jgi:AraC-like DNA-binding protein
MVSQRPRSIRINGAGVVLCEPAWRWDPPPARFVDFDLWYVWSGVGSMEIDGVTHSAQRGRIFLLQPQRGYHGRHDPHRRLGVSYIHFDLLDNRGRRLKPSDAKLPLLADVVDPEWYERATRKIVSLHTSANADDERAAALLLESVLLALPGDRLPARTEPGGRAREARMAEIMRYIRENPGQLFSVEELADRAAYAVDHFTRLFTETAGVSPKAFCIRVRIERAQELLRNSDMAVGEIAHTLGYSDIFHFSRQFKAHTGITPTRWRHADQDAGASAVAGLRPARTKR